MHRKFRFILFFSSSLAIASLLTSVCFAHADDPRNARSASALRAVRVAHELQGFNIRMWINSELTMGIRAWGAQSGSGIPVDPHLGLEYPTNSGVEHLFGGGVFFGCIDNGRRI